MDGWSRRCWCASCLRFTRKVLMPRRCRKVTPYRDYLRFIAAQDRPAALAAWREALAGLEEAHPLAAPDPARAPLAPDQVAHALGEALSAALSLKARDWA